MQDEVNEKTIALYIKTGKLTAQTLQKAMKAILSKGKKQLSNGVCHAPGGLSRNSDSMADRRGTGEATLPLRCLAAATPL